MSRIVSAIVVAALSGWFVLGSAEARDSDRRIALKPADGFAGAKGFIRLRDRGRDAELRVEIERVKLAKGTKLEVRIDGKLVGTMTLNENGSARQHIRNSNVPAPMADAEITVQKKGGPVILSAVWR